MINFSVEACYLQKKLMLQGFQQLRLKETASNSNAVRHVLGQLLSHFYPLILTTDCCVSSIQTIGSWRLWQVNRKCLLFIGTWSHLWYIQALCLWCTHICSFLFCLITRLTTVGYLCLFVFSKLSEILAIKYSQIYNLINIFLSESYTFKIKTFNFE